MAFNVNQFITNTREGLAREAYFDAEIPIPLSLGADPTKSKKISELCVAANLPVLQAEVTEYKRYGTGLRTAYTTGMRYSVLDLTFYCDSKTETIKIFQQWLNSMFNINDNTVEYKDRYTSEITLNQYDPDIAFQSGDTRQGSERKPTAVYRFKEAFPYLFGPINFSWGSRNNLILVPVSFVYTSYTMENTTSKQPVNNLSGLPTISQISRLLSVASTPLGANTPS